MNEAEYIVECEARRNPKASPGSYLIIEWQPRKELWPLWCRMGRDFDPTKDREMGVKCYGFEALGHSLMELTVASSVFYNHFVGEGVLDYLLQKARLV